MRLLITTLLIAITAGIAEWFAPWWTVALVAGIAGYVSGLSSGRAFIAGSCGIALLWLSFTLYRDMPNDHILTTRMAQLFSLPSSVLFITVTALIGGIVGGLAAWGGAHLRLFAYPAERR